MFVCRNMFLRIKLNAFLSQNLNYYYVSTFLILLAAALKQAKQQ
jgi:hypothetical protein